MTKIAYIECPTGIAGDMCLGALVHAGVPLNYLSDQLKRLGIGDEFHLWSEIVMRNGQAATKVHVDLLRGDGDEYATFAASDPRTVHHEHGQGSEHSHNNPVGSSVKNRRLPDIEQIIQEAGLPPRAEAWSLAVFRRLAEAEAAVHGTTMEHVHFHEVGATDAIVDIVGTCLGLDWLNVDAVYCSALPIGGGTIRAAHGRLPVPAPAVLKLWEQRQVPIYSNGIEREMVTPTGAALVTTLAHEFGAPPPMRLTKVGLGAGSRNFSLPNILRLWLGDTRVDSGQPERTTIGVTQPHAHSASHTHSHEHSPHASDDSEQAHDYSHEHDPTSTETVTVLETQVDDVSPQAIAFTQEALLAAGALDVFTQAVTMKKSRMGTLITVICRPEQAEVCETLLFRETTTLGIRQSQQQRHILQRHFEHVDTPYGSIRIKLARPATNAPISNAQPEYEDCAKAARQQNVPWREVHRIALQAWHEQANTKQI
ncbi:MULTISPECIES: nickel pincer cofactor biosynthesis protein LarC [unclassified Leptolyngbya]|uniref:nickel pincer cofactor biosynthesis protein LarC n=1 Tax=unclassified Leptolyngbya TaxID=2650499 RepID=UPI0016827F15|nr:MULTISPECIES: nickel pincer cofactor biosynthesis protein LarC [unclassified Leptolyngbya]MBD1910170.1 nickel pincer cofactor biosynthesis protein LarC [Leptolyngbya sp. FACHB-8]MBD2153602.1 nickel pincer cofactor biosynthesis protein LarC [Leptolyngbya sp. FACHB-16]